MADLRQRILNATKEMQLMNLATITEDGKPWTRYMVGNADEYLIFRFCTHLESRKVAQIRKNPNIHICAGVHDLETAEQWVQVEGSAEIVTDEQSRHAYWYDELKNYFSGPDDPNYALIVIKPSLIEFGTMGSMTPEIWKP
ncbi:MAG: pyridoxamine 5'-phosphate oxidase family protein [Nitrospiraceae bacterium]|nr:MAG: pyridoxamine 5'-phosphate oxidase family protein [Nitrospiraceae bacterium]